MKFLNVLVFLLVSAQADPGEDTLAYGDQETRVRVTHNPIRRLSQTSFNGVDNSRSSFDTDTFLNPRTLREKEKLEAHHDKKIRDLPPFTRKSLELIHPILPDADNNVKDSTPKKRHLRQSAQRVTLEHPVPCLGIKKIVQCKDSVPEEVCKAALVQANVQVVSDMPKTIFFAICVDSEADVAIVAALTDVEGVEDDPPRTLSVVKGSRVERHLQSSEQVTPYGIDLVKAPEFWARYNGSQGAGIKVCVIDTGLRSSHEDIRDADVSGSDNADLVTPWNQDGNSHGTHVSGTIAAQDNGKGVVGVAPEASLFIARVFDSTGEFTASNLVVAMNACADANANIISMSLGGPIDTFAERSAIRNLYGRGILFVAASGNDAGGSNLVEYPAAYDHVLSVGAVNQFSQVADFSTHNSALDVAAPGVEILSLGISSDSEYVSLSGTSMAAPHVAGVAALVWSQFPDKNVTEIEEALTASARDLGACGRDRLSGHGLVDAVAAAIYLEGGGAATENGNCISINVSLTTDDYGSETMYLVTSDGDSSDIVYRGGPYPDSQRSTYQDSFSIPDGCYSLIWLDTYGDGSNDPTYGIGEIALSYGGTRQVSSADLSGPRASFRFGTCGDNGASPTSPPLSAPVGASPSPPVTTPPQAPQPAPTAPPQSAASPTCGDGESLLQLSITTDPWSRSENHLYLFDDSTPDDEFIWRMPRFRLQGRSEYEGEACMNIEQGCFKFYFFDEYGDGLESGGLTLTLDGVVVLRIMPGDLGDIYEQGSPATYWYQEFGTCTTTSDFNRAR